MRFKRFLSRRRSQRPAYADRVNVSIARYLRGTIERCGLVLCTSIERRRPRELCCFHDCWRVVRSWELLVHPGCLIVWCIRLPRFFVCRGDDLVPVFIRA